MSSVTIHRPTRSDRRTAPANGVESTTPAHGFGDPTHRSDKITDGHWQRLAIVYVRQSTQHQVLEHRESTARQYALADRAVALGWPAAAVVVIDEDQGHDQTAFDSEFTSTQGE